MGCDGSILRPLPGVGRLPEGTDSRIMQYGRGTISIDMGALG